MQKTINAPNTVPTAGIAVNKSRMKLYKNAGKLPVYYLQSGQEFQIELFNPTSDVVLAKIILNGKSISQAGLVLKPGQRVFLDRYLDVAKKFLFDTYEVANTSEVKKAIEDNGDIKVEFYRESKPYYNCYPHITYPTYTYNYNNWNGLYNYPNYNTPLYGTSTIGTGICGTLTTTNASGTLNVNASSTSYNATNDACYSNTLGVSDGVKSLSRNLSAKRSKTIETGRVEEGSYSDQSFKSVSMNFDYSPFHTVEYKMLPISQKINTVGDISVKKYCTSCGAKLGKTDRFCSSCGSKA